MRGSRRRQLTNAALLISTGEPATPGPAQRPVGVSMGVSNTKLMRLPIGCCQCICAMGALDKKQKEGRRSKVPATSIGTISVLCIAFLMFAVEQSSR